MAGVNSRRYVTVPVTTLWTSPRPRARWTRGQLRPDLMWSPGWPTWTRPRRAWACTIGRSPSSSSASRCTSPDASGGSTTGSTARHRQRGSARRRLAPGRRAACSPPAATHGGIPVGCSRSTSARRRQTARRSLTPTTHSTTAPGAESFLAVTRAYLGLPYLWGGMCDWATGLLRAGPPGPAPARRGRSPGRRRPVRRVRAHPGRRGASRRPVLLRPRRPAASSRGHRHRPRPHAARPRDRVRWSSRSHSPLRGGAASSGPDGCRRSGHRASPSEPKP